MVTGAASGIGLAVARCFAAEGAELHLIDVAAAPDRATEPALSDATWHRADLAMRPDIQRLIDQIVWTDVLVNNAGVGYRKPITEFPTERWDAMISVMLTAPFLLIRGFLGGMVERGWGRIVNMSSIYGLVGGHGTAAYSATKHGLVGLTRTAALEAAEGGANVTVNAICPSYVRTPAFERTIAEEAARRGVPVAELVSRYVERSADRRLIEPEEVAELVVRLCDNSMRSVNGQAIPLDGGWLAG